MADLGSLGNGKPDPWRAGANENTVFRVSEAVTIEGKPLPAGRYGLHMIPGKQHWTLIFSKNADSWGSFWYDESADALRVVVTPHVHEYRKYLTYEFPVRKPAEAVAELQWEDLAVSCNIQVSTRMKFMFHGCGKNLHQCLGLIGRRSSRRHSTAQENTHLEQGLQWADDSINMPFAGEANFTTLSTKAAILVKLGRDPEAKGIMDAAIKLPSATPTAIHQYGRQLLADNKVDVR